MKRSLINDSMDKANHHYNKTSFDVFISITSVLIENVEHV